MSRHVTMSRFSAPTLVPTRAHARGGRARARGFAMAVALLLAGLLAACADRDIVAPLAPATPPALLNTNVAPDAMFAVSPRYPQPGDTVTFDASFSFDRNGIIQSYTWDLGNGVTQVSGPIAKTVYRSAGSYSVSLTVTDDSAATSTRSLSLPVNTGGAPASAVSASQSTFTLATTTTGAATAVAATITARTAAGTAIQGVTVQVGGQGRALGITQPPLATDAAGIATAVVTTPTAQSTVLRAIADFTLLTASASLTVTPSTLSTANSVVRLTDPVLTKGGDSTLVEVTARDPFGNALPGTNVSVSVTGGTATVRNEGPTDANGRRIVTVIPTVCGGAVLTVTASVNSQALPATPTVTNNAPAAYGTCDVAYWVDASDATTLTVDGSSTVTQWRDKSGFAQHVAPAVGTRRPSFGGSTLLGRPAVSFNSTNNLLIGALSGVRYPTIEWFVVMRSGATLTNNTRAMCLGDSACATQQAGVAQNATGASSGERLPVNGAVTMTATPATPMLMQYRHTPTQQQAQINRAAASTASTTGSSFTPSYIAIGGLDASTNTLAWLGEVAEVVIFQRVLGTTERDSVSRTLMRKWGLGTLTVDQGNDQGAAPGTAVPTTPRVRVTDGAGAALSGATITWQATLGGGSVTTATTTTDANGYATPGTWTLGTAGLNQLTAWLSPTAGSGQSVVFQAMAGACVYGACGAALWYDAQDVASTTVDGSQNVSAWNDKSGRGRHATNATSGQQPSIATGINGRRTVRATNVAHNLVAANAFAGTWRDAEVFLVARQDAAQQSWPFRQVTDGNGLPRFSAHIPWTDGAYWDFGACCTGPSRLYASSGAASAIGSSLWSFATVRANSPQRRMLRDRGLLTTGTGTDSITMSDLRLQLLVNYTGDVGELLVFPRGLSTAERDSVERSLMRRWGLGTLAIDAGNNQTGVSGATLPTQPRVRITDAAGNALSGATITWQVTDGGGSVSTATSVTDANGFASTSWTLGNATSNTLVAWFNTTAGSGQSVTFTATGSACAYTVCGTTLWFDASDNATITQSAGILTAWQDKTGLGRNATAGTGPQVVAGALYGRQALRFNGTTQFVPITDVVGGTSYTLFVVERRRSNRTFNLALGGTTFTTNANLHVGYRGNTTATLAHYGNDVDGTIPAFTSIANEAGRVWAGRWTSGARSLGINGATIASDATTSGLSAWANAAIGRANTAASGQTFYDGDIGEVLFFGRALSDGERTTVSQALMVKWGLGTFAIDQGNNQSAPLNTAVATPPRVRLTDATGAALVGATVTWQVTGGGGSVSTVTTTTDGSGYASTGWTLGSTGTNTLVAWLSGTAGQGQSVTFTATATGVCAYTVCDAVLWLDASVSGSFTTEAGNRITQWRDQSGYANHAAATSGSTARPTYSSTAYQGRPGVVFAGGANNTATPEFLTLTAYPWASQSAGTAFVVWRRAAANFCERLFDFGSGTTVHYMLAPNCGSHRATITTTGSGGEQTAGTTATGAALNTPYVTTVVHSGTQVIRVDGIQRGSVAASLAPSAIGTPGNRWLGRSQYSADGYLSGAIAEVLFFTKALNASELLTVEQALMVKWGGGILSIDAGNGQSATAGTSPAVAPQVRLLDANNVPLSGATVTWQITGGGARFGSSATTFTTTTNASGYASVPISGGSAYTLDAGSNQLTAWLSGTAGQGQSVVFTLTGTLPSGAMMRLDASAAGALRLGSDCSAPVAGDGQEVGCLADASGNGANATQGTVGARPLVVTNGLNGRPAMSFVNTKDNYLAVTATAVQNQRPGPWTIVAAARANATEDNSTNNASAIAIWPGWHVGLLARGNPTVNQLSAEHWTRLNGGSAMSVAASGLTANSTFIGSAVAARPTSTTFTLAVFLNGVAGQTGASSDASPGGSNELRIGQANLGGGTSYRWRLDGRIGEIVVFNRALADAERLQVERYLGWKWGVTVP